MTIPPVVECRALEKRYRSARVLTHVDLTLGDFVIFGLIGPNGAGKTTLLRTMVGLVHPSSGSVRVGGASPRHGCATIGISYFGGEATLPRSVTETGWRSVVGAPRRDGGDRRRVAVQSRGSRQLIGLRAALDRPGARLVVLDEPFEGLDPDASRWLSGALHARRDDGATVVVSSLCLHDLAGLCDVYGFLVDGHVAALEPGQIQPAGAVTGQALYQMFDRLRHRGA